jgi:Mn-dependent DtxR family transcriptional regulator
MTVMKTFNAETAEIAEYLFVSAYSATSALNVALR